MLTENSIRGHGLGVFRWRKLEIFRVRNCALSKMNVEDSVTVAKTLISLLTSKAFVYTNFCIISTSRPRLSKFGGQVTLWVWHKTEKNPESNAKCMHWPFGLKCLRCVHGLKSVVIKSAPKAHSAQKFTTLMSMNLSARTKRLTHFKSWNRHVFPGGKL